MNTHHGEGDGAMGENEYETWLERAVAAGGRSVEALGPEDRGVWLVTTGTTRHVFDLDARTYRRVTGPDSTPIDLSDKTVRFTLVEWWPRVGEMHLVWFDDPDDPGMEHFRRSSRIRSIVEIQPAP